MSYKPTTEPDWTGSGTSPSAGEKSSGFQPENHLPAQYVNWFWTLVSSWISWLFDGVLNREALDNDYPVLMTADQDGNVKHWLDANGYTLGQVISETYWWRVATAFSGGSDMSLGSKFYCTFEETGYTVTVELSSQTYNLGCNAAMVRMACPASPTSQNGVMISTDDASSSGDGKVFRGRDSVAVIETEFAVDIDPLTTASTFYFGFSDAATPDQFENVGIPSSMVILDYGENVFEGMSCDGTTLSKSTTGKTCVVDTLYHLRVEYHAASTPQGVDAGGAVTRIFIDGELLLEKTTNQPADTATLKPCFGVQGLGSDTAGDVFVGPVHFSVNYMTSSQVPDAV